MNTLSQAIEQLYAAFADVPKPRAIVGCPCCLDNKDIDTLLATPLREIGPRDLSPYASSAFLTVGGARIMFIFCCGFWRFPRPTTRGGLILK